MLCGPAQAVVLPLPPAPTHRPCGEPVRGNQASLRRRVALVVFVLFCFFKERRLQMAVEVLYPR